MNHNQSAKFSFIESIVNTFIGFFVATAANYFVLPLFGYNITLFDSSMVGLLFTIISILRSYIIRRLFEYIKSLGYN